jgi:tRNA (adenine57-N1/adenine58-N1)-methyltransferase
MAAETLKAGTGHHSRLGRYNHDDIIGKAYGSKVASLEGRRSVSILRMTPEFWTRTLPHRTQILYLPDISFITMMLDLHSGSKVIECGTGSGSFSHSLARAIAPNGHLFTFEYHETRAGIAQKEFEAHGLSPRLITLQHRDVCRMGFGLEDAADAVFLDLPAPWEAIPFAKAALNRSKLARICCFSPCIEQVQKTCAALRQHGFFDIEMYECLVREHSVYKMEGVRKFTLDPTAYSQRNEDGSIVTKRSKRYAPDSSGAENTAVQLISRPNVEIKGHTSYLTFASILDFHKE